MKTILSTLAEARVAELETALNAHLSSAAELDARGLSVSARRELQAAAAVNRRLADIKRKLIGLEYARHLSGKRAR